MTTVQVLRDRYVQDAIHTASPARLLIMLFDRLCLDLEIAETALEERDLATASDRLVHAQDITLELQASLDTTAWAGAVQLAQIYAFLFRRLIDANVAKDAAVVAECRRIVEPLRETWHAASRLQQQEASQPLTTSA